MAALRLRNVHIIRSRTSIDGMDTQQMLKWLSLIVLTLQNASQAILIRYARVRQKKEMFLSTTAVFWTEVVKLVSCLCIITVHERSLLKCLSQANAVIVKQPLDTLKVCVPSLIYTFQNNLLYVAVSNLSATTFLVTYQLKILTTAVCSVLMLRKQLGRYQWLALCILFVGVSLVQLQEQAGKTTSTTKASLSTSAAAPPAYNISRTMLSSIPDTAKTGHSAATFPSKPPVHESQIRKQSPIIGLTAALISVFLSGFAGVYFEKILKGADISVWLRNVQLSVLSIPMSLITMFAKDGDFIRDHGLLYGYDVLVWAIVVLYAIGGLSVAVVVRYADNILKGFATSVSILLTCVISVYIFDFAPSLSFLGGTCLVITAVFLYGRPSSSVATGTGSIGSSELKGVTVSMETLGQVQKGQGTPKV